MKSSWHTRALTGLGGLQAGVAVYLSFALLAVPEWLAVLHMHLALASLLVSLQACMPELSRPRMQSAVRVVLLLAVPVLAIHVASRWPNEWPTALLALAWSAVIWPYDAGPRVVRGRIALAWMLAGFLMVGVSINLLHLGLVFGNSWLQPVALPTLLTAATLFGALLARARPLQERAHEDIGDRKARSISTVGIANLVLIAFITGLASFAVLKVQVERALYQRLRLTMVYRSLTMHNAIQSAYQDVLPLAYNRDVGELMLALERDRDNGEVRQALQDRVNRLLPFEVGYMRFYGPDGSLLHTHGQTAKQQVLWTDYRDRAEIRVVWHPQQPYLDVQVNLLLEDGTGLGHILLAVPSPPLAQLLTDNFDLGDTGEMLVCAMHDANIRCVQSRNQKQLLVIDPETPLGELVVDSLETESLQPVLTLDEHGHNVMLAYGPVGPYGMVLRVPPSGMSMLVKMNTTELYAPIREQFIYVLPVLAVIILVGGYLLRRLINPLVRALRSEENRFRELTVLSSDAYWTMDAQLRLIEFRGESLPQLGVVPDQWLGRTLEQVPAMFEYATARQQLMESLLRRQVFYEVILCLPQARNGHPVFLELSGAPQFDESGEFCGYRGVARDITLRKLAENSSIEAQVTLEQRVEERTAELEATVRFLAHEIEERAQAEERFRSLTELSSDWYWELDREFRFVQMAGEPFRKGSFSMQDSHGKCLWELDWAGDPANDWDGFRARLETGHEFHDFTFRARDSSGNVHHIAISGHPVLKDGMLLGYRGIGKDVSERQRSEEQVRFLAHYDALTRLPNRVLLGEHVRLALDRARRTGTHVALLFVDLDRFKIINDSLGHEAGDKVLLEVAQRLTRCVRDSDLVARLGGDEFVILLDNVHDGAHVRYTARRMLESVREPIVLGGENHEVGASIGVAIFPQDGDNLSDLLKNSDAAMYRAKESGRNGIFFYSDSVNELAIYGERMDADLVLALQRNQFILHFQALFDIRERCVTGVEALLRWRHPQHGMLSPAAFLPAAEESGLIVDIGQWVLRSALQTLREWDQHGPAGLQVAINISPTQLREEFPSQVNALLREYEVGPHRLLLELPESQMLKCSGRELTLLQSLRAHGVRVVLDNFGAKASASMRVDMIKIDRSYIDGVPRALNKVSVIRAAIRLANEQQIGMVAEGVETREQYQWLLDEGCHAIQGFFFSHPMPAARLAEFVNQHQQFDPLSEQPSLGVSLAGRNEPPTS